jgi:hypothetical protein
MANAPHRVFGSTPIPRYVQLAERIRQRLAKARWRTAPRRFRRELALPVLTCLPWPQARQRAPGAGHINRRCGDVTVARIPINARVAEVRRVMRGGREALSTWRKSATVATTCL